MVVHREQLQRLSRLEEMGKWAVYMAALQASGVSTPSTYYVMNDLVTTENVDTYYDANSTY